MDNLSNKAIRIAKIEQNAKAIKIVDQEGSKYTLWIKKQDGTNTKAYEQWKVMELMVDSVVDIGFKSEEKTFVNDAQKTINYTERTVIGFRETDALPLQPAKQVATTSKPQTTYKKETEEKPDWEAITRGKVATNLAQGYLAGGKSIKELNAEMVELLKAADDLIKLSATFQPNEAISEFEESLETIGESIPF